ncbi:MAG TPA: hypothetical protein VH852_07075 [Hyphomicrobium sp.]|jgi:hypothetical protein
MIFSKPFWEVLVRPVVLPFFILALIDGALTVYGTSKALGGPPVVSLAAGFVVGLAVLVTLLCTFDIWGTWHLVLRESTFITWLLRGLWGVAFLYDWGTSGWGLYALMGEGAGEDPWSAASLARLTVIVGAGLVVCASTLVVSFMTYNERRENAGGATA